MSNTVSIIKLNLVLNEIINCIGYRCNTEYEF